MCGYNTFAGLRVGEVQEKSDTRSWLYIPSSENISDILTRGAPPTQLGPDSIWQKGPKWLIEDRELWPVTAVSDSVKLSPEDSDLENLCRLKSSRQV